MAESIQDILRRRRAAAFVGRGGQLALFRQNFDLAPHDDRKSFVFNIHGVGGVGKSTLIERWREIARECGGVDARVDEHVYGVPETMAALADQLDAGAMKEFRARYDAFVKGREQLERDPAAPSELWSRVVRTSVKVGLHASKAIPGAGPVVDLVDGETAADAVDRVRVFVASKIRDSRDVRLQLSPTDELSPLFLAGIARVAASRPVVLFFDTYEQTSAFLDGWLLDMLGSRHGPLSSNVVLVVAGRLPLDANRWSDYLGLVAPIPLATFTEAEGRQLLTAKGVADERTASVILELSGGLPLLIEMLAKNRPDDPSSVGDPSGTAVERFLKWEQDETLYRAALAGSLPRRIDEDLLAAAMDTDDAARAFDWLSGQPFVSVRSGRYQYHEVVRAPMNRWQRQRSPQRWRSDHARLADHYRRRLAALNNTSGWSDPAWRELRTEETYHRLCAGELTTADALPEAVPAADAGVAAARRWAEAVADAGRDALDDGLRGCGEDLLAAVGHNAKDCMGFLDRVLQHGQLDPATIAKAMVARALIHYYADRDEEAVAECDRALAHDPECPTAFSVRGAAKTWVGEAEAGLVDFDKAVAMMGDDSWSISRRAETYRMLGRFDEAIADFDRAVAVDNNDAWSLAHRGETYRQLGRFDKAMADFDRAISLRPTNEWAIASRGQLLRETGKPQAALEDLDRALTIYSAPWIIEERASTYFDLERYEEAAVEFGRAIDLDQDNQYAICMRAWTYEVVGRADEALAEMDRAVAVDPQQPRYLAQRGEFRRIREDFDNALADFGRALDLEPDSGWAIGGRAQVLRALGRRDEALVDFDRAIALEPGFAWLWAERGELRRLERRHGEAVADFNRAIEIEPDNAWTIGSRGQALRALGRRDDARADLDRAIALEPGFAWLWAERGELTRLQGRHDEAIADFNRADEIRPDNPWTLGSRGQALRALGRHDDALADLDRAIALDPTRDWIWAERGELRRLLGRHAEAVTDLDRAIEIDADSAWHYGHRARAYRDLGRETEAEADFVRAEKLDATENWRHPDPALTIGML